MTVRESDTELLLASCDGLSVGVLDLDMLASTDREPDAVRDVVFESVFDTVDAGDAVRVPESGAVCVPSVAVTVGDRLRVCVGVGRVRLRLERVLLRVPLSREFDPE